MSIACSLIMYTRQDDFRSKSHSKDSLLFACQDARHLLKLVWLFAVSMRKIFVMHRMAYA
jgi:hypothetical protein